MIRMSIKFGNSQKVKRTSGFTGGTHEDDEDGGHQFENKLWLRFYFIFRQ